MSNTYEPDGKTTDKRIKYCPKCSCCWQFKYQIDNRKNVKTYEIYKDFPSYGKKRVVCPKCMGM